MVERALGVELSGVDRLLDGADVHFGIVARENVVEAALRQPHVEGHLAALEAIDRHARARLGALLAPAGGLAEAGTDSASDTHAALPRTHVVLDLVQFHNFALAFAFIAHAPEGTGRVTRPLRPSAGAPLCAPGREPRACLQPPPCGGAC